MAEYSGEKELLGAGVAPEPQRRTGGALPPDTQAAKDTAKAYNEAAEARRQAADEVDPANRPPALGAPPVPASIDSGITAAPAGLGMGSQGEREDGVVTESVVPPNLQAAQQKADEPAPAAEPAPEPAPEPEPAPAPTTRKR